MAKLILLLVFVCFQFSSQEELTQAPDELTYKDPATETLDGEDKSHWYRGESGEDWKNESSQESDEDYDDDFEDIEKLIDGIENWIAKAHPEKSQYQWLLDIGKMLEDEFYDDDDYAQYPDINREETLVVNDDNNNMDLYYSWLYKMNVENSKAKRSKSFKRFWSV